MNEEIMKYESVLPDNFDGTFKFTNWTTEDFVGIWGGKKYIYPAETTSPMIIPEHSPLEIQHIRKKFAKDLAEREFFKSSSYANYQKQERNPDGSPRLNSIHQSATYNMNDLVPFIQKCLTPLSASKALVQEVEKEKLEDKLTRDEDGQLNTSVVSQKTSLKEKALRNEKLNGN